MLVRIVAALLALIITTMGKRLDVVDPQIIGLRNSVLALPERYHYYIDENDQLTFVPVEARPTDVQGKDRAILDLFIEHKVSASVSITGHGEHDTTFDKSHPVDDLGIHGEKVYICTSPPSTPKTSGLRGGSRVTRRSSDAIFSTLLFEDTSTCSESNELEHDYADGNCRNAIINKPFKSVSAQETTNRFGFTFTQWPHHNCQKGDSHDFIVAPGGYVCAGYPTYSYTGH